MKAFCLKAPTVRFVNLAIVFAGVFSREWFFNSRKFSFVHSRPRTLILPPPEPETLAVFRIKRAIHAPHVYLRLLRARRERPRRHAAEQRYELAARHSMTSSARVSMVGAMSRPIAFAVLRLITSLNLVGRSIGKSAALAPLRMRSMYIAARLYMSGRLGP